METIKTTNSVLYVTGMTCGACQKRVETKLRSLAGVQQAAVDFAAGTVLVAYDPSLVTVRDMAGKLEAAGYGLSESPPSSPSTRARSLLGALLLIAALAALARALGVSGLTAAFPLAEAGAAYHLLFVVGLITSAHCAAMCGGINVSQTLGAPQTGGAALQVLMPGILYNGGRVVSYTLTGAAVGALGQAVQLSGAAQGAIQLAAGAFMLGMGLNMLGLTPELRKIGQAVQRGSRRILPPKPAFLPEIPPIFKTSPLILGLLNGLLPCGPLQAMQVYALSTGSPVKGALSMLIFSLGTLPLMFGVSALSSLLRNRRMGPGLGSRVIKAGAVLVGAMGVTMMANGWNLGGFSLSGLLPPFAAPLPASPVSPVSPVSSAPPVSGAGSAASPQEPAAADGAQYISSVLQPGRYPSITVQAGIPVKWVIDAPPRSINGCNNRMFIRQYQIEHRFALGENVIEFTPEKPGKVPYSCWMGMIRGTITVVSPDAAAGAGVENSQNNEDNEDNEKIPELSDVRLDLGAVAVARMAGGGYQEVEIELADNGFKPALVVAARGIEARWIIKKNSLDPGSGALLVPAYRAEAPLEDGENVVRFIPEGDFLFSTADLVFYGYVKVVDRLEDVNIEAIKAALAEASLQEAQIP
ncbi:MAG: sulfite exporter TauE/SafE family protein [Spirochaetaceae bacterium]|jgi:sulfite exporter TauE/SafE/copper chaperone CopZ/plastocyanin domain-containing protein|nr:sulfite exporter TauE/SafE family protein [Spirochaetaceae bacterium]